MSFFSNNKVNKEYEKASANLNQSKTKAFDRVEFIMVNDDESILELADKLMYGYPLILNFEDCEVSVANKVISFLSGVIYALDGEIEGIQDKIFLFATKKDFRDGSLRKFVNEYK